MLPEPRERERERERESVYIYMYMHTCIYLCDAAGAKRRLFDFSEHLLEERDIEGLF